MRFALTSYWRTPECGKPLQANYLKSYHGKGEAIDLIRLDVNPIKFLGVQIEIPSDKIKFLEGALALFYAFPERGLYIGWPNNRHYHMTSHQEYGIEWWYPCSGFRTKNWVMQYGGQCLKEKKAYTAKDFELFCLYTIRSEYLLKGHRDDHKLKWPLPMQRIFDLRRDLSGKSFSERMAALVNLKSDFGIINFEIAPGSAPMVKDNDVCRLATPADVWKFLGPIGGKSQAVTTGNDIVKYAKWGIAAIVALQILPLLRNRSEP